MNERALRHLASRPSIFSETSKQAKALGAINLSQGYSDLPIDQTLAMLTCAEITNNNNQYSPPEGCSELRQQVARMWADAGQMYPAESDITITCGASQAIFLAISSHIAPGDEVIINQA